MRTITVLEAGKPFSGITFTVEQLKSLVEKTKNLEVLGQTGNPHKFLGRLDEERVSHAIKNIRFNPLTEQIDADVEPLDTPYGKHLALTMKVMPDLIDFKPIFVYDENDPDSLQLVSVFVDWKNDAAIPA